MSLARFELPRVLVPAQAARLGLSPGKIRTEVRRGNWRRIASGIVLTRPDEPSRVDWIEVGIALAGRTAALTGWDAARVHGLGSRTPPNPLVVVLSRSGENRTVGGVRIRRTTRPYVRTVVPAVAPDLALVPVVGVARAVADAALDHRELSSVRALVTSAIQRRRCQVTDLVNEFETGPRNGSQLLRLAISDALDGARSAAEADTAALLTRAGLPQFELNVPVVSLTGDLLFVLDVLWRGLRAALEINSREFHFSEADWKATMRRHNELTRLGLAVTHYPPAMITRQSGVFVAEVRQWLGARAAELGFALPPGRGPLRPPPGESPPPLVVGT